MTEAQWDKKLGIHTIGRDESHADRYRYPYEPTPYAVLQRLAQSGLITRQSTLMDYGCGMGRVGLFLAQQTGCRAVGVEYDPRIFRRAEQNRLACGAKNVEFLCADARGCPVGDADCFYFFNPFSVEVLRPVMADILAEWYENPRTMRLFFYYPNEDYRGWLEESPQLELAQSIDCRDLFVGDPREVILVYELKPY